MSFKFVFLWTDLAMWAMFVSFAIYGWVVSRNPNSRATWLKVLRDPAALCAGVVMLLFTLVTALDSVHFRRALPQETGSTSAASSQVLYDTRTESALDLVLARQIAMTESSYSAPLAYMSLTQETHMVNGVATNEYVRLKHGGSHLQDPAVQWAGDVTQRAVKGALLGLLLTAGFVFAVAFAMRAAHGGLVQALKDIASDRTHYPLRAVLITLAVVFSLCGGIACLMDYYHVFGTDQTGRDVLRSTLKSVRTAFVIGSLATVATLPVALVLGVLAGYYKGWVDEAIQYLYTTLSSVPNVLLIAACVLMVQVFLDKNPDMFETGTERSDLKTFLLCIILGLTGWATLCRLVRGETLKLRELDYVQAATAFGVSHWRIMARHIVPNVVHLVLITLVLNFSDLILYEAVLTYVGVGVDPTVSSFGGMINLARTEMSKDTLVWWSFASAFAAMVALVLSANLFADGVRDAFDPRARNMRPRVLSLKFAGKKA